MIRTKTAQEIEQLAEGGRRLSGLLDELEGMIRPGMTGKELDEYARMRMEKLKAKSWFLGYKGFPAAICVSVNEAVVHGLPSDIPFESGDLVSIDAGLIYNGLYTDSARTVPVSRVSGQEHRLLDVTRQALQLGINTATLGNTTGDIGHAVQTYVESYGFGVVEQLVGHGVGYAPHEDPPVPNYGRAGSGQKLLEGMVIAIEPMVTAGNPAVKTAPDGWTVVTADGSFSAHFEHTVAITAQGPRVLT